MNAQILIDQLQRTREYFDRSTGALAEEDSTFAPTDEAMTAAQQVAHVAQTLDWFREGAFRPEGFDMDFEAHGRQIAKVTSLEAARAWLDRAFTAVEKTLEGLSEDDLRVPIAEGPVMGGSPRLAVVGAIADHTAHHRGALTVYARLCGKTAPMPYM